MTRISDLWVRVWRRRPTTLDLSPYVGEWVAIADREVIAHQPTAREIVEAVQKLGLRSATLLRVQSEVTE